MGVNKFENSQYPFAAFVTNLSKYSEGKLVGEWVAFPTTKEKMDAVLEKIGVGTGEYQEYFLSAYDCYINGLSGVLGEHEKDLSDSMRQMRDALDKSEKIVSHDENVEAGYNEPECSPRI